MSECVPSASPVAISKCLVIDLSSSALAELSSSSLGARFCVCSEVWCVNIIIIMVGGKPVPSLYSRTNNSSRSAV